MGKPRRLIAFMYEPAHVHSEVVAFAVGLST